MKRHLVLIILAALVATAADAQNTTYGGAGLPLVTQSGYLSDYALNGTIVLPNGSVTLTDNSTYEHGNTILQNDGTWNSSTGGLDLFVGNGNNTIAGNIAPNFFHVRLNTGASSLMNITNAQGVNVAGQLQFNNGITTTSRSAHLNCALRFSDGATYTGGNSDAQHVHGYVTKTGDDAFAFPVGSGTDLRTLSISASGPATGISIAWFSGSPATTTDPSDGATHSLTLVAAPIKSVSPAGFWDWVNVTGTDDAVEITASIPDMSSYAIMASDLRLVGWDGTQWLTLSENPTATGLAENSTISGAIPAGVNITALAIGSVTVPLPVLLASFEGKAVERSSLLQWTTTEEVNASHFEVQRGSDARNFATIGTVAAKGESKVHVAYDFLDKNPSSGPNYYRLKQIDRDGTYLFSKIIVVRFDDNTRINIFPNPISDVLHIESDAPLLSLEVFDLKGMKIETANSPIPDATGDVSKHYAGEVNFQGKAPGIYLLKINGKSFKVLKD